MDSPGLAPLWDSPALGPTRIHQHLKPKIVHNKKAKKSCGGQLTEKN